MIQSVPLLLLEDNQADACLLIEMLEDANGQPWQVTHAKCLSLALDHLNHTQFEVALLDLSLPDSVGLDTINRVRSVAPHMPVIVLTGLDNQEMALQAVAKGAQDYLVKGTLNSEMLVRVIHYAIERGRILRQLQTEVAERQRSEQTLRLIVEGTASVTGEDFFRSLVRSLADALGARYALVSGCIDTPPTRVCTFAFWQNHELSENVEYNLYGTPCEQVFDGKGCRYYPDHVQDLFPDDPGLAEMEAKSYAGIPLFGSQGQLLGHLAVFDDKPLENEPRDTTILEIFAARAAAEIERQQVIESLRISQEKFSKAFRSSPSSITISTLSDGRYIEVNDSCLKMLGYNPGEMIGRSALELGVWTNPLERDVLKQQIEQQGAIANLEVEFRKKSGEVIVGLLSAEVIQLEEQPCLLSVTTDITLLKQATRALERLAEIGELASMIVHEIRNPLATLLMGINSFKRLELPERFQEYLTLSIQEGDRLQRLLNQILLYAKPQMLQQTDVDLNQLIADMVPALQAMPAAAGKQLDFKPAEFTLPVFADQDKLKQVVINLVTNAFEAVDVGETVAIALLPHADQVCLHVHNGGTPIPPDVLPKLTKPFITTKATGNGLGLAIVKRIVEAHNGMLCIESSEGAGTTIDVQLPTLCLQSHVSDA